MQDAALTFCRSNLLAVLVKNSDAPLEPSLLCTLTPCLGCCTHDAVTALVASVVHDACAINEVTALHLTPLQD